MNILFEIVHPADVLFFLNPIRKLKTAGHHVMIASRDKDVALELLDGFGIEHHCLSRAGNNLPGLAWELLLRDWALWRLVRHTRPDVMCGFGAVALSHIGKLTSTPTLSFYDTERAPLQHWLSLPFITHLYVPESYDGPVAQGRTTRFAGTKDFSFLHPDNFAPDRQIAMAAGLVPDRRNLFIRLVAWKANHDVGHSGWPLDMLRDLVRRLESDYHIHISSESPLPDDLRQYQYQAPPDQVHHLLAYCHSYIGESATMAGEAMLLGVPAVYATSDRRCYTDALADLELIWKIPEVKLVSILSLLEELDSMDRQAWQLRRQRYIDSGTNLSNYITEAVLRAGDKTPGPSSL